MKERFPWRRMHIGSSHPMSDSRLMFRSSFEKKKTYEYLLNIIKSPFLTYKPLELLQFSSDVLGKKTVISQIKKVQPQITKNENYDMWIENDELIEKIAKKTAIKCLKIKILPLLYKKLQRLGDCHDKELESRLINIQKTFRLTDEETDILFLYYLLSTSSILRDYLDNLPDGITSLSSYLRFKNCGHFILRLNHRSLVSTLSRGILLKIQLLRVDVEDHALGINDWCREYLSGVGKSNLEHEFFIKENNTELEVSDFDLPKDELLVLHDLLKAKGRCNILFYGAPGTGKTSYSKTIAKELKKELLTVKVPEEDDHKIRLQAIHATINLSDKKSSIILIDEADEILNTYSSFFFKSKTNKSWINNLLNNHDRKIIWIVNRSTEIDPSTMRRFSFSLEFKKLHSKNRTKILCHELRKKNLDGYFTENELLELCRNYSVDAGGIVNAISTFNINKKQKKDVILRKIRAVLKNHEKAIGEKKTAHSNKKSFDDYSLEGLNTSHKLNEIIPILRQFDAAQKTHSLSLLFYGLPGTGKSEFVHYLGNLLEKEVLLKRCSEIQSMWVGETEKNIAYAFQEAQENNSILFFDEADSFLFPRSSAVRSWEISFTNEILAQLDSFTGIVIFATNDIDGLDHAALRRFKFKIEFRPLTPEGNLHFYKNLLDPLAQQVNAFSIDNARQLKSIRNLTPGDFAVVKDQFMFVNPSTITHQKLIESLMGEVMHKKQQRAISGFGTA